jgi:hypothetical protein
MRSLGNGDAFMASRSSYDVNPDCSSTGQIKSQLLEEPKNGAAEMVTEKGLTSYAKDNPKYKCNEKQSDLQAYYYKSRVVIFYHKD